MFRCQECRCVSKPKETSYKKIIEVRDKEYFNKNGKTSYGFEIVKELQVCGTCKAREEKDGI